jgi:L-lactate dehydrogenase (cytochrome)
MRGAISRAVHGRLPFLSFVRDQVASDLRGVAGHELSLREWVRGRALRKVNSLGEMRAAARRALPGQVFDFVDGAAGSEITARRNTRDLAAFVLRPRALQGTSSVDTRVTVLGQSLALPVLAAPTGLSSLVHPDGEIAVAAGAHAAGTVYMVSASASWAVEDVADEVVGVGPSPWFQVFLWRDRQLVQSLVHRAHEAGYGALAVSVDVPVSGRRLRDLRNGFAVPPRIGLRSVMEGLTHPTWSSRFVRQRPVGLANMTSGTGADSFATLMNEQMDPSITWREVEWLRDIWDGPLIVKGVLTATDAVAAVERGADAVVVSNHGGRQLDQASSTVMALPAIVEVVGDRAEILVDGGIRTGADVVTVLSLGARACLIGRPPLFGLAVGGREGVRRTFDLLREELVTTMTLLGCSAVADLGPEHVSWPSAPISGQVAPPGLI